MLWFKKNNKEVFHKNAEIFHQNIEIFENMKIRLNGRHISDVILKEDNVWRNLMTLKVSSNINNVLRKNRRFLIVDNLSGGLLGLYVEARKDLDALIMVKARFSYTANKPAKWVEKSRTYVSLLHPCFERGPLEKSGEFLVYQRISGMGLCEVDICGQAVIYDSDHYDNFFAGAKEEAIKFFGGYVTLNKSCKAEDVSYNMLDFKNAYSFNCLYEACFQKSNKFAARIYSPNYKEDEAPSYLPLNDDISLKLSEIFKKDFIGNVKRFSYNVLRFMNTGSENRFAYIQKDGDTIIYRCFYVDYDFKFKKADTTDRLAQSFIYETEIIFSEYKRVYIHKDSSGMSLREYYDIWENLDIIPVLMDDLTGTVLEYTGRYIKDWIDYLTHYLHDPIYLGRVAASIDSIVDSFISNRNVPYKYVRYCTSMAYQMVKLPIIEMLFSLDVKNPSWPEKDYTKKLKDIMLTTWLCCPLNGNGEAMINQIFGEVDSEQKSIHKILGLPKGMLECILISGVAISPTITNLKTLFSTTPEAKQYFLRMCESECDELIRTFHNMNEYITYDLFKGFEILVRIFGPSNCGKYLDYLRKTRDEKYFYIYFSYLEKIAVIGPSAKGAGWKFNNLEEVKQINEQLHPVYMLALNEAKYKESYEKFKEFYPKWEKYLYENGKYMITYPKKPTDLVEEGINLHHCVKQFIEHVADGETTILFIRRKKKPDKSFYTLEIRNGRIWQCHGHSNNNVTEELKNFLKEFCKEKRLTYSSGKELCGVP